MTSLAFLTFLTASAGAQTSCADPDDLCTGDPCVIPALTVIAPCVVDFGARAVVLAGKLRPSPAGGDISFTAQTITVNGPIISKDPADFDGGGSITLSATSDLLVASVIKGGAIALDAGNDVTIDGALKTGNPNSSGGSVLVEAQGWLTVDRPIKAKARLTPGAPAGGDVVLRGAAGVVVNRKIDASGTNAGTIDIESETGAAQAWDALSARGDGGSIEISALTGIVVAGPVKLDRGTPLGGSLTLSSPGVTHLQGKVQALNSLGGSVTGSGGSIVVGGMLLVDGGSVDLSYDGSLVIETGAFIDAGGNGMIGTLGSIRLEGATVTVAQGAALAVAGPGGGSTAGEIRLRATAGDATLGGDFDATGSSGIIEGTSFGNLTATGAFRAAAGGCIALAATGTLSTSGATFDVPLVGDCPGSPSGAFVDRR